MIAIDGPTLTSLLPPSLLIPHLLSSLPSLSSSIQTPPRLSYPLDSSSPSSSSSSSSLLLMPSWSLHPSLPYIGIKILTSFPSLSPSISASYSLFSSSSGQPLASLDGTLLTLLRTSALSAAASALLSPSSPSVLLLAGAGALAPHLVSAHLSARPSLSRFLLWNRTLSKSQTLASCLQNLHPELTLEVAENLDEAVKIADVIVCATGSERPLVRGELIKKGAHLNLMGSYSRAMRECDEVAVRRGRVFVDTEAAIEDAGELAGVLERGDVAGTLAEVAGGKVEGRSKEEEEEEVTVFKSVGAGVFDLLAAQLAYESYVKGIAAVTMLCFQMSMLILVGCVEFP